MEEEFETIKDYMFDIGVDLAKDRMTPLLFDYQCAIDDCSNTYRSLNYEKSGKMPWAN